MSKNPTPTTNATMKEKEEVLRNDRHASTYAGRAQAELDLENVGRHAKPNTVIGVGAPEYPRLPENSWTNDPTGVEPPLNIDVNAVEAVGEKFEIEELGDAADSPAVALGGATLRPALDQSRVASSAGADEHSIVSDPSNDVEPPPAPASKPKPKPKPRGV
jgi:hypothetical protein